MNGKIVLLLVDDEPDLLDVTKALLETSGPFDVVAAGSGSEALSRLADGRFDAVISDYQMPEMDGIALLKLVRAKYESLPFILYTGRGREEVVIDALNAGADFYLQKGGDIKAMMAELSHKVRTAVARRRAESSLRLAEFSIANSTISTLWFSADGLVIKANEAAAVLFDQSQEDLLGMHLWQLMDIASESNWSTAWDLLREKGQVHRLGTHHAKNGIRTDIEADVTYMKMEGKEYAFAFVRDVTERIRTDHELQVSREKLRMTMDEVADIILAIDQNGVIRDVNRTVKDLMGYDRDEVVGRTVFDFFVTGTGPTMEQLAGQLDSAKGAQFDVKVMTRSGERLLLQAKVTKGSLRDETTWFAVCRDITETRRTEEVLRQKEAESTQLLEEMVSGFGVQAPIYDDEGRPVDFITVRVNKAFEKILGASREDIVGRRARYVFPNLDEFFVQLFGEVVKTGRPRTYKFRSDNWNRWFQGAAYRTSNGMAAVTFNDINEQVMADQVLTERERKRTILNDITFHDILNQVQTIQGHLSLIKEDRSKERITRSLSAMDRAIARINHQISFYRDYEEVGSTQPIWQRLEDATYRAMRTAEDAGFEVSSGGLEREVFADKMLELVFYNLVDNSRRHGQRVTKVSIQARLEGEDLVIDYQDDGIGIPPDEKENIFQKRLGSSIGLGLFLVREILRITGIDIRETGSPGQGAQFIIRVPPLHHRPPNEWKA